MVKTYLADKASIDNIGLKIDAVDTQVKAINDSIIGEGNVSSIYNLVNKINVNLNKVIENTDELEPSNADLGIQLGYIKSDTTEIKEHTSALKNLDLGTKMNTLSALIEATNTNVANTSGNITDIKAALIAANITRNVPELTKIGDTTDSGASASTGSIMGKLNRTILNTEQLKDVCKSERMGLIDNIYAFTSSLVDFDHRNVPSIRGVLRYFIDASVTRTAVCDTELVGYQTTSATYRLFYFDYTMPTKVLAAKSVINVKSFLTDGANVRQVPATFVNMDNTGKSDTVRIYVSCRDNGNNNIISDYSSYFLEVVEYI